MNHKTLSALIACGILLAGCQPHETSPSARRYIDFFEIDRISDITDPQSALVTVQFRVLERPEVQADLALSKEQALSLQKAYNTAMDQIPGMDEFKAQRKAAKQKTGLTKEESISQNLESSRQIKKITSQFRTRELQRILTPTQRDRLHQIVLQVRGPLLLLLDAELASALEINSDQTRRMREVADKADVELIPRLQKFGRGFISGYGQNETQQKRTNEMGSLIPKLTEMIKQRDRRILQILTARQIDQFKTRQGKPLKLDWDSWDFLQEPFDKHH